MSGLDPFLRTHKKYIYKIHGKNEWIRPISTNTYTKYMVKMSGSDPFLQIHNLSKKYTR